MVLHKKIWISRELQLYVKIVQDMYDDSIAAVRCAVGVT